MPALPSTALGATLLSRNATSAVANTTTSQVLQVVCAFPVSGQYGPGSRYLYYILILACVVGKNIQWLRNACLAAALLFPAVAALHGIVLASLHLDTAVDMDIFGAFQLCAIGILAAPITVKLSRTYFNDPGRNAIFVWTILVLIGMLCLTVEFFRTNTTPCSVDDSGHPLSTNPKLYPYNNPPTCNLTCSPAWPRSPIRQDSANNIYVIPQPLRITFGMGTLLAAACCIPAILSLVSMWNKILEINWRSRFGNRAEDVRATIEGTNGATLETMTRVNSYIRQILSVVEAPVYGAAVFFILIMGEWNFWSTQVYYQTEPMTAIGQWAPMAGTGLAVLGSLYIKVHKDLVAVQDETPPNGSVYPQEPAMMSQVRRDLSPAPSQRVETPRGDNGRHSLTKGGGRVSPETTPSIHPVQRAQTAAVGRTWSESTPPTQSVQRSLTMQDLGGRRRIARTLLRISDRIGNATEDSFDDRSFKRGPALDYPTLPGEEQRNDKLPDIMNRYNHARDVERDADGVAGTRARSHSRAPSFNGSMRSGLGIDLGDSPPPRAHSPRRPTLPTERISGDLENTLSHTTSGTTVQRRATLEVPLASHQTHSRTFSGSSITFDPHVNEGPQSPAIVVSPDPQEPDDEYAIE
ncbi:hypothetical protein N431DRAFT_495289 [Stipitochalara longipes BDJ]|nr:hypothetical protein N431DRAFT_495289 [Stipitochalara longipes BDJ]